MTPIRGPRPTHPSGKPKAAEDISRSDYRGVYEEPLVPRLRARELKSAVGFMAQITREDEE